MEPQQAGQPLLPKHAGQELPTGRRRRTATKDGQAPSAQPQGASRAGRDLKSAVAVALVLLGVLAVGVALYTPVLYGLVAVAVLIACHEMTTALAKAGIRVPYIPLAAGALAMLGAAALSERDTVLVATAATMAAVAAWRILDGNDRHTLRDCMVAVFVVLYIPLLACFVLLTLGLGADGPWLVALLVLLCVANDTGGYAMGVWLGKHPLAPSISPKKSWEGLAGSIILALAVGLVAMVLMRQPLWLGAVLGLVAVATSTLGDLSESLIKRDLGIKDMGTILPGHGGVLDRVDSILLSAPVMYLIFVTLLVR